MLVMLVKIEFQMFEIISMCIVWKNSENSINKTFLMIGEDNKSIVSCKNIKSMKLKDMIKVFEKSKPIVVIFSINYSKSERE